MFLFMAIACNLIFYVLVLLSFLFFFSGTLSLRFQASFCTGSDGNIKRIFLERANMPAFL